MAASYKDYNFNRFTPNGSGKLNHWRDFHSTFCISLLIINSPQMGIRVPKSNLNTEVRDLLMKLNGLKRTANMKQRLKKAVK